MPAKIPESLKFQIVQQWLQGKPRNNIAPASGISLGSVSNIVDEWRHNLGIPIANDLRDLAVILKQLNITPVQCADGFRAVSIMQRIGVALENIESFTLDTFNRCMLIGLSPENISVYLQDLIEFSKNGLPLSKISEYIQEKTDEKIKLETEIKGLRAQIAILKQDKEKYEFLRNQALQEKELTISDLQWYSNLRSELEKYSMPINDISKFALLIDNLSQHSNYDVSQVIKEFSDLELLKKNVDMLQSELPILRNNINELEQQRQTVESFINLHRQTMSAYNDLKSMGFGLKELNFLYDTICEIGYENYIPLAKAVQKFLSDVEDQYDRKLGFEAKLEKLKNELNSLRKEKAKLQSELLTNPLIGPKLIKLNMSGVSDQIIINIATLFEKYGAGEENDKDGQLLLSDLDKYSGLKSALRTLVSEVETLKKEKAFLEGQKQSLDTNNQTIQSSFTRLVRIVDFLQGIVASLTSEILSLVLIYLFALYFHNIKIHFDNRDIGENELQEQPYRFDEFTSLSRSINGEDVPLEEMKKAVLKAIQALLNRIPLDDDLLAGGLLAAYDALNDKIDN